MPERAPHGRASMRASLRALGPLFGLLAVALAACGARSEVLEPDPATNPGADGGGGAAERVCLPNCSVGHECCVGGCGGPAVATDTACCTCLDGEVDSSTCPGATCGGGECTDAGDACATHEECCSGWCDYPSADAPEKSCLLI